MEYFISNLEDSLKADLPLLSLMGAFILIDSIAAIDTERGRASKDIFMKWFKKYLPEYLIHNISQSDYYTFRCALLHQLSGSREDSSVNTILLVPKNLRFKGHQSLINKAFLLDLPIFVKDIINAARECIKSSKYYDKHKHKIITLHPNGLDPYISGIPVIACESPAN